MAEDTFLSDDFLRQIMAAGEVDVLVGVPSLNNHETIQHIISAVLVGFVKYFPRERAAVVNVDGGSQDGTPELVKSAAVVDFRTLLASSPLRTMHMLTTSYGAMLGKGGALQVILAAADLLRPQACAIISPDLKSITPEWIEALIRPIYREGFDFVAPVYQRRKFDGLLINHIVSPLVAAAYGCEIQEPQGEELALSGQLASHYLNQDCWQQDFMRFAPEVWMTTAALAGDYRVCQAFLGPKVHSAKSTSPGVAGTIQQVVGALFRCLELHESYWTFRQDARTLPVFGFEYDLDLPALGVNSKRMLSTFRKGVEELVSILELILSPPTLQQVRGIAKHGDDDMLFPDELWVRVVYEFAGSFHHSVINRGHLLQALTPLYLGRIHSFLSEDHKSPVTAAHERIKRLYERYESLKPYLTERWNAKA